jgi:hypothetical protein
MSRRRPVLVPVDLTLEESDRDWLVQRAAAKGLTPERYMQRLVLWERRKDERTHEQMRGQA